MVKQPKRSFTGERSFDSFYFWKLQNPPSSDEKLLQALTYTRIAPSVSLVLLSPIAISLQLQLFIKIIQGVQSWY